MLQSWEVYEGWSTGGLGIGNFFLCTNIDLLSVRRRQPRLRMDVLLSSPQGESRKVRTGVNPILRTVVEASTNSMDIVVDYHYLCARRIGTVDH